MVQWLRVLTVKHWMSHCCGLSLAWGACDSEMPSSAPVGPVVFL